MPTVDEQGLDVLFRNARTHNGWQDKPVGDDLLRQIYDLAKWGATATNSCPMRMVFVKSKEAKEKLAPCMDKGNLEKTMAAPVTAIIGYDLAFYEQLPTLSPHNSAINWFKGEGKEQSNQVFSLRNGSLQGAYFMLAARALGLDCGPMGGFNASKVDEIFFAGTQIKSNFLCNLGYGDPAKLYPRAVRLAFDEACKIA